MKKIAALFWTVLFLAACGSSNKTDGASPIDKLSESGACSQGLLDQLNTGEGYYNDFLSSGLSEGRSLVRSFTTYESIRGKYASISCKAIDRDTGQQMTISLDSLKQVSQVILNRLYQEHIKCKKSGYAKNAVELQGCNDISFFVKNNLGYD